MSLKFQSKKSQDYMCRNTCSLTLVLSILLASTSLYGCENSGDKAAVLVVEPEISSPITENTGTTKIQELLPYASTAAELRTGKWLGGSPPINKRASGIDTYYRIEAEEQPDHLIMTLRFEGIIADDAKIEFRPIDGAKFKLSDQRSQWRLKPDMASEITFTIVVPDGISYLTLDTFQNKQGASRAFLLKTSN